MKEDKKLYEKGLSEFNKGRYKEALKIYKRIIPDSEVYSDTLNDIGLCYKHLNQYMKARVFFNKSLELEPKNWVPYYNIAISFAIQKKYREAVFYFEQAIEFGADGDGYYDCATNYELANNQEKAISRYKDCINKFPDYSDAYFNLANLYSKQKQYVEANKLFLKLIKIDPNYLDAYINLGINLSYVEKYKESIEYFDEAVKINPKNPSPYILKGLSLHDLEEYAKTVECYGKAIKLEPGNPDHYEVRGDSYYNWDKDELALQDYKKALDLGSKSKRVVKRIKELETIIKNNTKSS